jgi:hypothetical protein
VLLRIMSLLPETHFRVLLLLSLSALAVGQGCSRKSALGGGGSGGSGGEAAFDAGQGGGPVTSSGVGGGSGVGGSAAPACPGSALWMNGYGDTLDQVGLGVVVDAAGDIVLTGVFQGSIDLGGGPLVGDPSAYSIYVAKLDPSGHHLWSHAYPGGRDFVSGGGLPFATVAVAPSGNVILGGDFTGTVDFGAGPVSAATGFGDGFVVAFDPDGSPLWSVHYGDPPLSPTSPDPPRPYVVESVAVDPAGDVLVLGFHSTGVYGGMFVVKLDPQGNLLWRKPLSTGGTLDATVRSDTAGDVIIAGITYSAVDFGDVPVPASPAVATLFRGKLTAAGDEVWSAGNLTVGLRLHPGNGVDIDPEGNVILAGGGGDLDLDVGCGVFPLGWTTKVMALDGATGACRWMTGFGELGAALAVGESGRAFIATDSGDRLVAYPDSGEGLPASACDQVLAPGATVEVHGVFATPDGRVLMTGGFSSTASFTSDATAALHSAGMRDVFVASF